MNRQLTCPVSQLDTSMLLAQELVHFGFINEVLLILLDIKNKKKKKKKKEREEKEQRNMVSRILLHVIYYRTIVIK